LVSYSKLAETSKEFAVSKKSLKNRIRSVAMLESMKESRVAGLLSTPQVHVESQKETTTKYKKPEGKRPRVAEVERWSFTDESVTDDRDYHWGVVVNSATHGWVVTTAAADEAGLIDLATVGESGKVVGVTGWWRRRDTRFEPIETAVRPNWCVSEVGHGYSVRILEVTSSWIYFEYTHACPLF
jgi:hypothetical protein